MLRSNSIDLSFIVGFKFLLKNISVSRLYSLIVLFFCFHNIESKVFVEIYRIVIIYLNNQILLLVTKIRTNTLEIKPQFRGLLTFFKLLDDSWIYLNMEKNRIIIAIFLYNIHDVLNHNSTNAKTSIGSKATKRHYV